MTDIFFLVLLVIELLIFLFVVFLLRLNLCASEPKFPEIKSHDYEINKIMETVQNIKRDVLKLSGLEAAAKEDADRNFAIIRDNLLDVRAKTTVLKDEVCMCLEEKRLTQSASKMQADRDDFICRILLAEKIDIADIPVEIRTTTNSFYVTACRVCRNQGVEKYNRVLDLLKEDLNSVNVADRVRLARLCENLLYENLKEMAKLAEENKNG